jgi:hypothetical protein
MPRIHISLGELALIAGLNERAEPMSPAWEAGLREILGAEVASRCLAEDPAVVVHPAALGEDGRLYDSSDCPIERFTVGPTELIRDDAGTP